MAFTVSYKEIAVVRPTKIIRRNLINMTVAFKLHFSVGSNFVILESNALSVFNCGYDFIYVIAHLFVFGFYLFINKGVVANDFFAGGCCQFTKFINNSVGIVISDKFCARNRIGNNLKFIILKKLVGHIISAFKLVAKDYGISCLAQSDNITRN